MILPKHSLVPSACSLIQSQKFDVVMRGAKEVSKTVYARQRVWMLVPKHLLVYRQRLSVHRLRLFILAVPIQHSC
jgi:hypothetical protein